MALWPARSWWLKRLRRWRSPTSHTGMHMKQNLAQHLPGVVAG
jgi:hypothetical protein